MSGLSHIGEFSRMVDAIANEVAMHLNPGENSETVADQAELWRSALAAERTALCILLQRALGAEMKRRGIRL